MRDNEDRVPKMALRHNKTNNKRHALVNLTRAQLIDKVSRIIAIHRETADVKNIYGLSREPLPAVNPNKLNKLELALFDGMLQHTGRFTARYSGRRLSVVSLPL